MRGGSGAFHLFGGAGGVWRGWGRDPRTTPSWRVYPKGRLIQSPPPQAAIDVFTHTYHTHTHCDSTHSHIDHCSGQDLPSSVTLQTSSQTGLFLFQTSPLPLSAKPSPAPPPRGPSYPSLRSSQHPGSPPFSQGLLSLLWDPHYLKVPSSFPHHYLNPLAIILRVPVPGVAELHSAECKVFGVRETWV